MLLDPTYNTSDSSKASKVGFLEVSSLHSVADVIFVCVEAEFKEGSHNPKIPTKWGVMIIDSLGMATTIPGQDE